MSDPIPKPTTETKEEERTVIPPNPDDGTTVAESGTKDPSPEKAPHPSELTAQTLSAEIDTLRCQLKIMEVASVDTNKKNKDLSDQNATLTESVEALNKVVAQLRTEIHAKTEEENERKKKEEEAEEAAKVKAAADKAQREKDLLEKKMSPEEQQRIKEEEERIDAKVSEALSGAAQVHKKKMDDVEQEHKAALDDHMKTLEAVRSDLSASKKTVEEKDALVNEQAAKIVELNLQIPPPPDPDYVDPRDTALAEMEKKVEEIQKEKDDGETKVTEVEKKYQRIRDKLRTAIDDLDNQRVQFEWQHDDLKNKVKLAEKEAIRLRTDAAEECAEQHRKELTQFMSFVHQTYQEIKTDGPKPSLQDLRAVLLAEEEQQKLVEDNTSLNDENVALRTMMDRLLTEFSEMSQAAKDLGEQLVIVQTQLMEERTSREDLLKLKANDLEELYAGMLLKKQDELDRMAILYRDAERTLQGIIPRTATTTGGHSSPSYYSAGTVSSPFSAAAAASSSPHLQGHQSSYGSLHKSAAVLSNPRDVASSSSVGRTLGGYSPSRGGVPPTGAGQQYQPQQSRPMSASVKANLMMDI